MLSTNKFTVLFSLASPLSVFVHNILLYYHSLSTFASTKWNKKPREMGDFRGKVGRSRIRGCVDPDESKGICKDGRGERWLPRRR